MPISAMDADIISDAALVALANTTFEPKKISRKSSMLEHSIIITNSQQAYALYEGKDKLLGRGSYGRVKLCQSVKDRQWYAVKIISHCNPIRDGNIARELSILMRLERLHGYLRAPNKSYLITQYYEGKNVNEWLYKDRYSLSFLRKSNIFMKIVEQVTLLHKLRCLHRDIGLRNVMYNKKSNSVYLIDFGLSVELKEKYFYWGVAGTGALFSFAPEISVLFVDLHNSQKNNPSEAQKPKVPYSFYSDAYALGIFLGNLFSLELKNSIRFKSYIFQKLKASTLCENDKNLDTSVIYRQYLQTDLALEQDAIPAQFTRQFALVRELVDQLTHQSLHKRLNVSDLIPLLSGFHPSYKIEHFCLKRQELSMICDQIKPFIHQMLTDSLQKPVTEPLSNLIKLCLDDLSQGDSYSLPIKIKHYQNVLKSFNVGVEHFKQELKQKASVLHHLRTVLFGKTPSDRGSRMAEDYSRFAEGQITLLTHYGSYRGIKMRAENLIKSSVALRKPEP